MPYLNFCPQGKVTKFGNLNSLATINVFLIPVENLEIVLNAPKYLVLILKKENINNLGRGGERERELEKIW